MIPVDGTRRTAPLLPAVPPQRPAGPRTGRRRTARVRATAALALTVASALVLAACSADPADDPSPGTGTGTPTTDPSDVTIGLTYTPDIQFAPFYVAEEAGYYEEAGVDVTLRHHGAAESLFGALEAGEEDVVVAGGDEMLQARAAGVPVVNVATLYQSYPVVLIVPEDSDIEVAADLAGRSVGIPGPFGETYFGLLALLADAGLAEDDVDVQHIGFTQQAALVAGHVDAVMGFANNDAVQFERAGLDVRLIPLAADDGAVPLVGIGLGAHERALADDRAAVAAVVEATLRGVADIVADPEAAVEVAAEHIPGLTGADQRAAALATLEATVALYTADGPGDDDGAASPGAVDLATWSAMAEFMEARGLLGGPVDVDEAVTADLLPPA
ncbi:ABC transporter substrate-binding protein [Georgenia sp. MJ206]|uniref:ABC transporter substrate-binding protein n=1 Tax=Georgenia wangjunii TaxID=3117730 RepID=UPI002F268FD6